MFREAAGVINDAVLATAAAAAASAAVSASTAAAAKLNTKTDALYVCLSSNGAIIYLLSVVVVDSDNTKTGDSSISRINGFVSAAAAAAATAATAV